MDLGSRRLSVTEIGGYPPGRANLSDRMSLGSTRIAIQKRRSLDQHEFSEAIQPIEIWHAAPVDDAPDLCKL